MSTTNLIPVFTGAIQHQSVQLCNARDLHHSLESQQQFANWIRNRIEQYGFVQDEDYLINLLNRSDGKAGRRRTEYHLTLDMAKELAMVENNEKGRQIRRYFISLERKKSLPSSITPPVWTRPAASSSGNEVALNINTARTLIAELKTWTSSLPDDIGSPLWEALDDLNRLMIRGWTEVDEAMLKIEFASIHLKRWLGEGRKR